MPVAPLGTLFYSPQHPRRTYVQGMQFDLGNPGQGNFLSGPRITFMGWLDVMDPETTVVGGLSTSGSGSITLFDISES